MSSSYGENLKLTIFGESHSPAIGMTLEGIPAGSQIDMEELQAFLERRAPGRNDLSTMRREEDIPEFLCGIVKDRTCGTPITAIIRNRDTRSEDYSELKTTPRPGHADYTAEIKYGGFQAFAGGGHFSGRLTAPLCVAGGICLQLLRNRGITILTRILSIGSVKDSGELNESTADKAFPVVDDGAGEKMKKIIAMSCENGDSTGGIIECRAIGIPAGLGDPMFDGMENRIASIIFGIPGVKGIEFGNGFEAAALTGSLNNDQYCIEDGEIRTLTNNCGGILGGITNGMPLTFQTAIKPTSSIGHPQRSVNLQTMEETMLSVRGRHDPCIVPRAVPCIEAAAAIAIYDAYLGRKKEI